MLTLAAAAVVSSAAHLAVSWQYSLQSAMAFEGTLRRPGFVAPREVNTPMPGTLPCEAGGRFAALIKDDGSVKWLGALEGAPSGTPCQRRYVIPVIDRWRFKPASWNGRPTGVVIYVLVDQQ